MLLGRCRPSQQRFRSRECRCGIPDIERIVSFQRATTPWSSPPNTLAATVPPTPEGAGFPVEIPAKRHPVQPFGDLPFGKVPAHANPAK